MLVLCSCFIFVFATCVHVVCDFFLRAPHACMSARPSARLSTGETSWLCRIEVFLVIPSDKLKLSWSPQIFPDSDMFPFGRSQCRVETSTTGVRIFGSVYPFVFDGSEGFPVPLPAFSNVGCVSPWSCITIIHVASFLPFFARFVLVPHRVLSIPSAIRAVFFFYSSSLITLLIYGFV